MPLTLLTPPGVEPVSLSETRTWLRVSHTDEDDLIASMIRASREVVERQTGRSLITQSWREILDHWPLERFSACGTAFAIKAPPLISVEEVRTFSLTDETATWDGTEYRVDTDADPGRLVARAPFGFPRPGRRAGGIEIDFTAGYGASANDVPDPLREAILRLVAHRYASVEPAESARRGEGGLPEDVAALLRPYQQVRL